jgi:putative tricarboxylic transport membrane protein
MEPSMPVALRNNKDFWAGLMLIAIGAAAMILARNYPYGTALRMGPGYFPTLLGGILALFGLYLVVQGLRRPEAIQGNWSLRALIIVPLTLVLFGLMDRAGFVPALAVLIFGSAAASTEFRLIEVALLTVALTIFCAAVFIWGLGLPYPLLAGF